MPDRTHSEEVNEALLVLWQQFSRHAHIQQYELGGGLNIEIVGDAAP